MFSCEFCKIYKKTFFTEHLRTTAFVANWTVSRVAFVYHSKVLFYKIIIQLFSTGIFLGLWSSGPPCNFTEQLFFAQLWMAASNYLINQCDQKNRQVKNQIIKHQIRRKIKATRLVKFLSCFFKLVSSNSRKHYSIALQFSAVQLKWTLIKTVSAPGATDLHISQKPQRSRKKWDIVLKVLVIWIYSTENWIEKLIL